MEYSRDLAQKWQYVKEDNKLPYVGDKNIKTNSLGYVRKKTSWKKMACHMDCNNDYSGIYVLSATYRYRTK